LNSGNVVFDLAKRGDALETRIHDAVELRTGVSASVITMTAAELVAAIEDNPIVDLAADPARFLIGVVRNAADGKRLQELTKNDWTPDVFAIGKRVAYLWCPDGILASKLVNQLSRVLGDGVTTRNLTTMLKLHAMVD
jgi:uncharacterized protein (DUF1697 family)